MATFLEVLAITGLVTEACSAAGMHRSGAYNLRHRDPVFGAAWQAAETLARPVVADGLRERSIKGTVERHYHDGVLVSERRYHESWLGLAVLKRLDKQAESARTSQSLAARMVADWPATLAALRAGGTIALPEVVERLDEVDKVDRPPPPGSHTIHERAWLDDTGVWLTDFPPPRGFTGEESGTWDGWNAYRRTCTAEEAELLAANHAAYRAEEDAVRDAWFAKLRAEAAAREVSAPGGCGG